MLSRAMMALRASVCIPTWPGVSMAGVFTNESVAAAHDAAIAHCIRACLRREW